MTKYYGVFLCLSLTVVGQGKGLMTTYWLEGASPAMMLSQQCAAVRAVEATN